MEIKVGEYKGIDLYKENDSFFGRNTKTGKKSYRFMNLRSMKDFIDRKQITKNWKDDVGKWDMEGKI